MGSSVGEDFVADDEVNVATLGVTFEQTIHFESIFVDRSDTTPGSTLRRFEIRGQGRRYEVLLQSDIAFEVGTGGGPLFDENGAVVGIVVAIPLGNRALGFALPADVGKAIFDKILSASQPPIPVGEERKHKETKERR